MSEAKQFCMRNVKFRKVVVMAIAVIAVMVMAACGSDVHSKNVAENSIETLMENEESEPFQPSSVELSAEEAIAIAENGFRAIKEMSPEAMIKYTDIELLYYMGHAEEADDEKMLGEIQDYQYNVENAYKLQMSYDGIGEGQESYVLVVCANGQWELDVCLAAMRDAYHMIMQIK